MHDRHRTGDDGNVLGGLREALAGDAHGVVAEGDGIELKLAAGVGRYTFGPFRRFGFEHHHGVLNRPMLRVVHHASNRTVNVGEAPTLVKNKTRVMIRVVL